MARLLDGVVGHVAAIERLIKSIETHRLASTLLFLGPSGVGKKKIAKALAQALVCENSKRPCGTCPSCLRAEKDQHENILFIEPSTTQIKIEQVRVLKDLVRLKLLGRARVAIIDDAHMMTPQAANTLLKVLEEPPANSYFILISSQEGVILPTLRSRSQAVRFAPLLISDLRKLGEASELPLKSWTLSSSQGRADRLNMLRDSENEKLRDICIEVFKTALHGNRFTAFSLLPNLTKEKDSALFTAQCWQHLIRDIWFQKLSMGPLMNPDHADLIKANTDLETEKLEAMVEDSMRLERDILANIDRNLLFEEFWLKHSRRELRS